MADLAALRQEPMEVDVDYRGSKRTTLGDRVFGVRWADRHGILIYVVCDMDSARQHDTSPLSRTG